MSAWFDRRAERDLYDLWAMATRGLITAGALALYCRYGPSSRPPSASNLRPAPTEVAWRAALGHQTLLNVTAAEATDVVAAAWAAIVPGA